MSIGFGFSVGDFFTALDLIATVIDALRESGNTSIVFRELVRELLSLETALIHVKRLDVHDSQQAELQALKQAAARCQISIDEFWSKCLKYQPHILLGKSASRWKQGWTKVKWTLCRKDDLAQFKVDIQAHTTSINILLAAMQLQAVEMQEVRQIKQHCSLFESIQQQYTDVMQQFSSISSGIATIALQGRNVLQLLNQIVKTNINVFHVLMTMQSVLRHVPQQIDRQQPVFLIDALGNHTPFHLEFIQSADALISVLRINLAGYGNASKKIDNGEFVIQDTASMCDIILSRPWKFCFRPGQRVVMSMIFDMAGNVDVLAGSCPACWTVHDNTLDVDIECSKCGMVFRRTANLSTALGGPTSTEMLSQDVPMQPSQNFGLYEDRRRDWSVVQARLSNNAARDMLSFFRRVRLRIDARPASQKIFRDCRGDVPRYCEWQKPKQNMYTCYVVQNIWLEDMFTYMAVRSGKETSLPQWKHRLHGQDYRKRRRARGEAPQERPSVGRLEIIETMVKMADVLGRRSQVACVERT